MICNFLKKYCGSISKLIPIYVSEKNYFLFIAIGKYFMQFSWQGGWRVTGMINIQSSNCLNEEVCMKVEFSLSIGGIL